MLLMFPDGGVLVAFQVPPQYLCLFLLNSQASPEHLAREASYVAWSPTSQLQQGLIFPA
jgi:hypothetical protein